MDKDDTSKQKSKPQSLCGNVFDKVKKIVTNITIEPATFVISFANSLDNVSVQQLQIYKSCRNDFGFNETVCNNLVEDFPDENKLVQDEIAQFNVYQEMVISIFPVFFAFYLGAWCDIFGRKFIMFIFFGAKILGQVILVALAYYIELPKEWYLITLVPTSLAGGYAAFSMSLIAFIADISKPDERAFRMGMIFFSQSLGRPLATPLGAYLLQEGGYICVIASSLVGLVLGLVFLYLRMRSFKWEPVSKSETESTRSAFSLHHIKDAFIVTFKKRPGPNRKYLFTLIIMSMLQVIPWYGEMCIAFLYVRTRFGWGVTEYSTYSSIVSAASIVGQPILLRIA